MLLTVVALIAIAVALITDPSGLLARRAQWTSPR
jgi:hypothetical protein